MDTPGYIFISYSRKDQEFVDQLASDLRANGMSIWLDHTGLTPGTPNWEQAIRDAIDKAGMVLLVASPSSRASMYVQGELTLAKIRQKTIYPVWADGDNWIDSVSLDMVNHQYLDCRDTLYESALPKLITTLSDIVLPAGKVITLSLPTHERVELNVSQFSTAWELLNQIYINYLQDWYRPITYGTQWLLGNIHTKQLAITWDWLMYDSDDLTRQELFMIYDSAGDLTVEDFGVVNGSVWGVWEASRVRAAGVATNRKDYVDSLLSEYGMRDLWLMWEQKCLTKDNPENINPDDYQYAFLRALFGTSYNKIAFVDGVDC